MGTEQAQWHIDLLGGLRARGGGHVIDRFQTRKTASLLAYLAFHPRRHAREELADLLWPEAEPEAGRNRLSQAVGWLRSRLEPPGTPRGGVLLADRQAVGLDPRVITTDVAEFEAAIRTAGPAAEGMPTAAQVESLRRAVLLYQGDLLPGQYEDWVLRERQRLLAVALSALRRLALHAELAQDWETSLDYARRALAAEPLDEDLHCDLMRLLTASGQPAAALRQFRDLERLLSRELGATPSPATLAFIDRVRQGAPSPPMASPNAGGAAALPAQLTRFFGREAEIIQVQRLVRTPGVRLVTLIGPGGAGKTRLAVEAAANWADAPPGGVWFLSLADLHDAGLILAALADLLRLPRSGGDPVLERIAAALSPRPVLLVLDNLEHILEGAAPIVRDLLARVPGLTVLVTSRQRLNLAGEWEIAVPPLPSPVVGETEQAPVSPESLMRIDSVRLFTDRAQAVRPSFAVTPQNVRDVALLCARLEGLPLAIELCASWAQTLTPAQMLAQLTRRFDLLVSRRVDITPRHRTLRATLEYSFLLLPPDLQEFFIRISVFRGGWTLEAASAVCLDGGAGRTPLAALAAITELRERSLIVVEEATGEMRYRMLETLREFAAELWTLAVEGPLRRRHAGFFLALAEQAEPHMTMPGQAAWLARLEAEHDNLRAALAWSVEADPAETGLRLAVALSRFWEVRGYLREARQWLERLLPFTRDTGAGAGGLRLRARALNAYANALQGLSDFGPAEAYAREALALWRTLGDASGMASSLEMLGAISMMHEDYGPAVRLLEEARSLAWGAGDEAMAAGAVHSLGRIALAQEDWAEAWVALSESLRLHRALGDQNKAAAALNNLGLVARYRGDLRAARDLLHQALAEHRDLGDRPRTAISLLNIGTVDRLDRHPGDALSALKQAATLALEIDDRRVQAWCVKELGHLACSLGRFDLSLRLLSAAEALRSSLNMSFNPFGPAEIARDRAAAQEALGAAQAEAAWAAGGALTSPQACAEGLMMT